MTDPESIRILCAAVGSIIGCWPAAIDAYPREQTARGLWIARVLGWLMASTATGYGVSVALATLTPPPDWTGIGWHMTRWAIGLPTGLHAGVSSAAAHALLPDIIAAIKRRLGGL